MRFFLRFTGSLVAIPFLASVAFGDSGTLLVLNKSDNNVSLINLATKKAVATIPTGIGPHEVAVSPNGRVAVVANYEPSRRRAAR